MIRTKRHLREFSSGQRSEASRFIANLPPGVSVHIEEWVEEHWRFVLDERSELARNGLDRLTPGARFRVRPVSILA
jgi:hypothetical protein